MKDIKVDLYTSPADLRKDLEEVDDFWEGALRATLFHNLGYLDEFAHPISDARRDLASLEYDELLERALDFYAELRGLRKSLVETAGEQERLHDAWAECWSTVYNVTEQGWDQ